MHLFLMINGPQNLDPLKNQQEKKVIIINDLTKCVDVFTTNKEISNAMTFD